MKVPQGDVHQLRECTKETPSKDAPYANVASRGNGGVGEVWIHFGREDLKNNLEHLEHCLVSRWGDSTYEVMELVSLKSWASINRKLNGNLHLVLMSSALILSDFENANNVERVWHLGLCFFEGRDCRWSSGAQKLVVSRKGLVQKKFG